MTARVKNTENLRYGSFCLSGLSSRAYGISCANEINLRYCFLRSYRYLPIDFSQLPNFSVREIFLEHCTEF